MNSIATPTRPWSRARWAGSVAMVLGAQLLLVFGLSERLPVVPRRASTRPEIRLVLNPETSEHWGQSETVRDPTLFALVSRRGFSGQAWLRNQPSQHSSAEWIEPPRLLGPDANRLAAPVTGAGPDSGAPITMMAGKPAPRFDAKAPAQPPLTRRTILKIEGRLVERRILSQPPLPALPAADVLMPTTLEVAVNPEGNLMLARSLPANGMTGPSQKQADQQALELVKAIRFEPASGRQEAGAPRVSGLTWGRIIFHWQTVEAAGPVTATANP